MSLNKLTQTNNLLIIFPLTQTHQHNPTRITFPTRPTFTRLRASTNPVLVTEPAPTLYEILGINTPSLNNNNNYYSNDSNNNNGGVTLLEIKKAYKEMALRYHPDVSPPGRAEEYTVKFIRVQEAYETLSDPNRRALYDGDLAKRLRFGFHSRRRDDHLGTDDKSEWKSRWQSQLSELKFRSATKNSRGSTSWSEKMRRQNDNLSNEV